MVVGHGSATDDGEHMMNRWKRLVLLVGGLTGLAACVCERVAVEDSTRRYMVVMRRPPA